MDEEGNRGIRVIRPADRGKPRRRDGNRCYTSGVFPTFDMRVRHTSTAALAVALCVFAGPTVLAQQGGRQSSSKIVAFDEDLPMTEPAAAPEPVPQPVESVTPSRSLLYGRLVPSPPRLDVAQRPARSTRSKFEFTARPAVASSLSVSSNYGVRTDPFNGVPRMHTGVDLAGNYGDSVGAAMSGTIQWAGRRNGYGNLVVVDHGNGIATYYAHLSAFAVVTGEKVEAAQLIGYVGSTGRSTGPHLHYEVRVNGYPIEPSSVIGFDGEEYSVNGHGLGAPGTAGLAQALPKAPGGTRIDVDWTSALSDDATRNVNGMAVDLE
jgi:hypothetical protein